MNSILEPNIILLLIYVIVETTGLESISSKFLAAAYKFFKLKINTFFRLQFAFIHFLVALVENWIEASYSRGV